MAFEGKNDFTFIWNIKYVLSFFEMRGNVKISSPEFKIDFLAIKREWNLDFYPHYRSDEGDISMKCFLTRKTPDPLSKPVFVDFAMEFSDASGNVLDRTEFQFREIKANQSSGWDWTLEERGEIYQKLKSSSEDALIIRCIITNLAYIGRNLMVQCEALTVMDVKSRIFKWNIPTLAFLNSSDTVVLPCLDDTSDFELTMKSVEENVNITFQKLKEHLILQRTIFRLTLQNVLGCKKVSEYKLLYPEKGIDKYFTKENFKFANVLSHRHKHTLICEFTTVKSLNASSHILRYNYYPTKMDSIPILKMDNPFHDDYGKFYMSQNLSDIKLRVGKEELPVHKTILAARSPVFYAMFDQKMLETQTGVVVIEDMDIKTLQHLIKFIYTESLNEMDYEGTLKLLLAADRYQVQTLVQECCSLIFDYVTVENACEIIAMADMINQESLRIFVLNFIFDNAPKVLSTPDWSELLEKNVKLASDVLKKLSENLKNKNNI